MSTCLKSEILRLSVGVAAGVPAAAEGAVLGHHGGGSVCRQCANCPVALIARGLNGDAKFFLSSLYTGRSDMAVWNKTCPVPL